MGRQKTVIVKDYTGECEEPEHTVEDLKQAVLQTEGILARSKHPHRIDPDAQKRFDEVETICDAIAITYYGKMTVTVDHQLYQAYIELELDYVEFFHEVPFRAQNELTTLSETANHIHIIALPSKKFLIYLDMPYFVPIK